MKFSLKNLDENTTPFVMVDNAQLRETNIYNVLKNVHRSNTDLV